MGQSQASRFSSKISEIVFQRLTKLLQVRNDMGVSEKLQNFHFGVEYPFKDKNVTTETH